MTESGGPAAGRPRLPGPLARLAWALAALLVLRGVGAAPLEVYGRLPELEDVVLSPDGTKIAFVQQADDQRLIAVKALADFHLLYLVRVGDSKLRSIQWADEQHLLVETSMTDVLTGYTGGEREWFQMSAFDLAARKHTSIPDTRALRQYEFLNAISGPVMVRHIDGHTMLFAQGSIAGEHLVPALFRVDLQTGVQTLVARGTLDTRQWLLDSAGTIVAEEKYSEARQLWWLSIPYGGDVDSVATIKADLGAPRIVGLGPDDDTVLFALERDGEPIWVPFDLRKRQFGTPLESSRHLTEAIDSPVTCRVIGGSYVDDDSRYVFFDPALQKSWDAIVRAFPGSHLQLASATRDMRKLVVRVEGPAFGFLYELVDLDRHSADPLGDVYSGVDKPFEVRRIDYPAADGLQIPGYLTLPPGRPAVRLPLIVFPHGGPAYRDTADFDWWSQAMAGQGYAVLQPNFRGSTLGQKFEALGEGEFGRKMETDLSDGVRYLVEQGIADAARVCIVGASYGGYAALAGVTLDPGVYRCAVAVAGISDPKEFLSWVSDNRPESSLRYEMRLMGVTSRKDPALDAISPIRHVDAITVPVLLIHGKDDTVVPYDQSDDMYDALRARHKKAQFVKLRHEDHWLSRSETRLQMLQATIDFLRANNPPD